MSVRRPSIPECSKPSVLFKSYRCNPSSVEPYFRPTPTRRGGLHPPRPPRAFSARRFSARHLVVIQGRVARSEFGVSQRTFGGDSSGCARSGRQSVPAGPGLSRFRCVSDGRATVAGPGRAECSRPIPVAPDSGPASARPATGWDRAGTTASSPAVASALPRCGRADERRFRRGRLCGPGRAARRSGNCPRPEWPPGCRGDRGSPCSPRYAPGPGVPREWLRCRPGMRSNSVAAGVAAAGVPSAAGVPREAFPLRLRRTGQAPAGPARDRSGGARPLLGRCGRMRGRSPPYTPRPCRLVAAALPLRR
jgi:hypothetical protein